MAHIEFLGHKRSPVSKLVSSSARYIQRCDTDKVSHYVTKFNYAFNDFESAHEDVMYCFSEDLALCDAENDKFIKIEEKICILFKGSKYILEP